MLKKILFLFSTLIVMQAAEGKGVLTQVQLETAITGKHTKIFAADFLYKEPIDPSEWNNVVNITYDFVKKHNLFSKTLDTLYKQLKQANDDLMKEIQYAYDFFYNPFKKRTLAPEAMQLVREQVAQKIDSIVHRLAAIEQELESFDTRILKTHGQEKVSKVLYRLAVSLSTTAVKAQKELFK